MSTEVTTCVAFECDGCGLGWDDEEGTPHFVLADPSDHAAATAELVKGHDWTVVAETAETAETLTSEQVAERLNHFCRSCSAERHCAAVGHQWGQWIESWDYLDPDWKSKPHKHEQRFCERDHCDGHEVRPVDSAVSP